jgi:hypothetical protein
LREPRIGPVVTVLGVVSLDGCMDLLLVERREIRDA